MSIMDDRYNTNEYENTEKMQDESVSAEASYTEEGGADGKRAEKVYKTVLDGKPRSRGWSVASMVLGILSVVCCCFTYGGFILGVMSLVFAFISRRALGYFDGMAIAGIVLGTFGAVFGIFMIVSEIYINSNPEIMEWYYSYLENLGVDIGGESNITNRF